MNLLHGVGEFFAIDIGTQAMRVVQLAGSRARGFSLLKYAYIPMEAKLLADTSELGRRRLGEAVLGAVQQAGITTKNVALGLPAQKTFTSIVETENLPERELQRVFKYEMEKYVPMQLSEAKVDYLVLGVSPNDPGKAEVLLSSSAKEYVETQMETLEKVGFNVIAMEPEPLALGRALGANTNDAATLIVDFGTRSTDVVVMYRGKPRLVRSIPGGFDVIVQTVTTAMGVEAAKSREFILRFGLAQDKVEGQVFKVLDKPLSNYAAELAKSVRFFQTNYTNVKVGTIILSGFAAQIPLMAEYIEAKTNITTEVGNPWQFVKMTSDQQQALASVASEFSVALGLAERSND